MAISWPIRRHSADDDPLAQGDHVVLVDEGHLDVELGELRLPVGAEVLVPVAAGDLVVPLHPGHHEQLLEQLRALRQCVPGPRGQPGRDDEVARALGRGTGQGRCLDLDETVPVQHVPGGAVDLAAQPDGCRPDRVGAGPGTGAAAAPPRPPRCARRSGTATGPPRRGSRRPWPSTSIWPVARFGFSLPSGRRPTSPVTRRQDSGRSPEATDLVAHHDLRRAAGVAQVDEGDPAVITPARHPAGESDGLADVVGAQRAGLMGAQHGEGSLPARNGARRS